MSDKPAGPPRGGPPQKGPRPGGAPSDMGPRADTRPTAPGSKPTSKPGPAPAAGPPDGGAAAAAPPPPTGQAAPGGASPPSARTRKPTGPQKREAELIFADDAETAQAAALGKKPGAKRPPKPAPKKPEESIPTLSTGDPKSGPGPATKALQKRGEATFEIRKGRRNREDEEEDEDEGEESEGFRVMLPRSILQQEEQADLERRFGQKVIDRYELDRHQAVQVGSRVEGDLRGGGRSGRGILIALAVLALLGIAAFLFRDSLMGVLGGG